MSSDRAVPRYGTPAPNCCQESRRPANSLRFLLLHRIQKRRWGDAAVVGIVAVHVLFGASLLGEACCRRVGRTLPSGARGWASVRAAVGFDVQNPEVRADADPSLPAPAPTRQRDHRPPHGHDMRDDDGVSDAGRRRSMRDVRLRRLLGDPLERAISAPWIAAAPRSPSDGTDVHLGEAVAADRSWMRMFAWLASADVAAEVGASKMSMPLVCRGPRGYRLGGR